MQSFKLCTVQLQGVKFLCMECGDSGQPAEPWRLGVDQKAVTVHRDQPAPSPKWSPKGVWQK